MQVKASQATTMITKFIQAKLVPMMKGSPGCGKSSIVHQIAADHKLKLIDLRLSQCDPCDLLGFPQIKDDKAGYVPMSTFPIDTDTVPEGYNGWLLFLDEFNAASKAVQAAAYKLVLDRMVGMYHLHKNVAIVCAGNLDTDNAIVEDMSTALQSRLVHLELVIDSKEWINWATTNGVDHHITSFINFKPGNLYTFKPDHSDNTYACPRTWEFASRVMKITEDNSPERLPMLAGTISEGVAREFSVFCRIYNDLPSIQSIMSSPDMIAVPVEPSILYALTGSISHNATNDNFAALMKYVCRLPTEFQVVCLRETMRRKPALLGNPDMQRWVAVNAQALF